MRLSSPKDVDMDFAKCCLVLCLLGIPHSGFTQNDPLTMEELVSLKRVTKVRLSPTGDVAAYLLSVPRKPYKDADGPSYVELHTVDLAAGASKSYVAGEIEILGTEFSASGDALFFLALRNEEDKFPGIWNIPLGGGEATKIHQHTNGIVSIHPSPDGKRLAFLAPDAPPEKSEELAEKGFKAVVYEESVQTVHVWMMDLESGDVRLHELPGSASQLNWSNDGQYYAVVLAPTPLVDDSFTNQDIYIVDSSSALVRNSLGSVGKLGSFAFSPNDQRITYVGSVDINDPREGRLFVVDAKGGDRRELLPDYPGHVQHVSWRNNNVVEYLGARGLWTEVGATGADDASPSRPAPDSGPIIRRYDARPGIRRRVGIADTPRHPPEVYAWDDDGTPRRLTVSNPELERKALAQQEPFRYEAEDGMALEAVLVRPLKRTRRASPLAIFVHGGPEAHDSMGWVSNYSRPAQVLAGQGFAVAYPNYRGSTGRGVAFSKLGQNDYADEEFTDILDLKKALVRDGIADTARVGVSGGSYGGYATMWSATALSEHYAAGVAFVGISNQVSKFGTGDIPWEMYHAHSRQWPWEDWLWMLERSPIYHADKNKTPLLIMHGDKDPRVHPSQSLEMYRNIKLRTKTPVRLVFYPEEGHGNRNTAARLDYGLRLERWLRHYLLGPGGEPPPYELDHAQRLEQLETAESH